MRVLCSIVSRHALAKSICVLALAATGQICKATVIYSNLGSGTELANVPVGTDSAGGYYDHGYAVEVIPTTDSLAGTVDFWAYNNGTSDEATIEIAADNGSGLPGTILTSQSGTVQPFGGSITTFTFSTPVTLTGGSDYWVIFSGPNLANLEYYLLISNTTSVANGASGAEDEIDSHQNSGNWYQDSPGQAGMPSFDLTDQTTEPEPGTFVSASLALLFLIGFTSWRKRNRGARTF